MSVDQVLSTTEEVLRRYGPAKATVADVARELGISPGSIYRFFPSKTALREAVTRDWLDRMHGGLGELAAAEEPAPDRLRRWLLALHEAKRRYAAGEPGLFETYSVLVRENSLVADEHIAALIQQLRSIVQAGVIEGTMPAADPDTASRGIFLATLRFHDPLHAQQWSLPESAEDFAIVLDLLLAALTSGHNGSR